MQVIRAYTARTQAQRAKSALDAAAILTLVINDPDTRSVQLWVPDELADHARSIVARFDRAGYRTLCFAA
jgi:hypothetical protein